MKRYICVGSLFLMAVLGGCVESQPKVVESSALDNELYAEMKSVKQKELGRCFKVYSRDERFTTYQVFPGSQNVKSCGFIIETVPGSHGLGGTPVTVAGGMDMTTCELKALSCLRPGAAKRIAAKYGLKIEPGPFSRP